MKLLYKLAEELGGRELDMNALCEIRMRSNRVICFRLVDGSELTGKFVKPEDVRSTACRLMENSVYACEEDLKSGYFTSEGGCRIGVCGRLSVQNGSISALSSIGSICIRIPREIRDCAKPLLPHLMGGILILSPPGFGKTTLLRDLARLASDSGKNVAVADERREICACREGVPQLDAGRRTDVMDGGPKAQTIPMLIRACSPDVIVADEIGSEGDAQALLDASRCGVAVAATAHAASLEEAKHRKHLKPLLENGVFSALALLGERPGKILEVRKITCGVDGG